MDNSIIGQCGLCRNTKELRESHIVPKFVGRKLKKTSIGSIRRADNPNCVVQDIEKHYLLCADCEERFSGKETWFASNIFSGFIDNGQKRFEYNSELYYFIVSLSWRSLFMDLKEYVNDVQFDAKLLDILLKNEKNMRMYLLGEREDAGDIKNHIFFLDRIDSINFCASDFPNVVMHRSITSYTVYGEKTMFTISKLMGIVIVTFYTMSEDEVWINTEINMNSGVIEAKNQKICSEVGKEFEYWMEQAKCAQSNISEKQREKIIEKLKKAWDNIEDYAIYQDWLDDANLLNTLDSMDHD